MSTYKSPHSGGYTNQGYEFIKWIWPNSVSQLTRDGNPTSQDIIDNVNLNEMAQWVRSLNKIDRKLIPDFTKEMIAEEIKLAWLYVHLKKIPKQYKKPLNDKINNLSLNDKETMLFKCVGG